MKRNNEKGFTLITTAFGIIALIAVVGLAVDIGRVFIAKNEAQNYVDSASLAATMELDGTEAGFTRARDQVAANPNHWNFGTSSFSGTTTAFARDRSGPWEDNPADATGYRYARAIATVQVPLTFLTIFRSGEVNVQPSPMAFFLLNAPSFTMGVNADSSSGQETKNRFREGLFPFSPLVHNNVAPDFGLVRGQLYTLRWASNPKLGGNTCAGDDQQSMIDLAEAGGGSERGYIEETAASTIRAAIVDDYQTAWRGIGDSVNMTGGAKQTQLDSLITRVGQDGNTTSPNYTAYAATGTGTGRRIVGAPINTGYPDYRVVQIGAFYLLTASDYNKGGNQPFCAEYLGPWVQGTNHKGAGGAGAYVVRIVK